MEGRDRSARHTRQLTVFFSVGFTVTLYLFTKILLICDAVIDENTEIILTSLDYSIAQTTQV